GLMWWIIRSSHHSCVKPFGTRQQAKENAMSATDAMFSPRDPWRIPCVRCALRVFFCFYRSDAARLTKEAHPFGMKLRRMGCPVLLLLLLDGHAFVNEKRFGAVVAVAGDFADLLDHVIALGDLAEDGVFAGQPAGVGDGDEELRAIGVGAGVGHGELARFFEV